MELPELRKNWETFGRVDPYWAILSDPRKTGNRWDHAEFFASGVIEIDALMEDMHARCPRLRRRRALDFGCGVGRLTQALAGYFDRVDGVDIAESMLALARDHNHAGTRCRYHHNDRDDLRLFRSDTFDLIYSVIVLQHIAPAHSRRYVAELVRV